jgi:hypothetical protein
MMTSEMMEKIRKDFEREPDKETLHWEAYVAGYMAGVKRFAERPVRWSGARDRNGGI